MFLYNYIIHPIEIFYKVIYLMLAEWLGSYGIAIIALSFLSFVLLYPFTRKAYQIQQEELYLQKILQEQIKDIKANYSGAEQFDKIQRLYDRYSYHPVMAVRSVFGLLIQLPFLLAVFYMLSNCTEIQGISWGVIPNLGKPDALLHGINLLPFAMAFVSVIYAFIVPNFDKKQIVQTVIIAIFFLVLLYSAPSALLIFWTCNLFWSLLDSVFGKKIEWLREFVSDNELAFHIIFALALTVGLLVPLEVYINNASQLWFSIKDILKYFLTDTAKYFVLLMFVYVVFGFKKIKCLYLSILLGMLFGVFLQSYVIGIDYGLFDGHEIAWEKYAKEGLLNTFIWLFCLGETFVVFKRFKFDLEKLKKYVKPVTFGIVVIQCIALMFALKNNPLPDNAFRSKDSINVLTTKDMFTISSKDNIIVFLLDAFDAKIFERIIERDSYELDELKDFAFYPDTTSVFGLTHTSLPQILTGKTYYNDRSFENYLDSAWKNNIYYETLRKNNYDICIYTEGSFVSKNALVENMISEKIIFNKKSMKSVDSLALFRMTPHYLKKFFYDYNPNEWMNLLANKNVQAYNEDDMEFYKNLKKGLITNNNKNSFRFYHLVGAHLPYIYDREMEYIAKNSKGNEYDQCIGVLKIVKEFIRQMKQKDVFDNSTFVIMADHGVHNQIGSRPLLCIKQPHSKNETIKISKVPISYTDFLPMIVPKLENEIHHDKAFSILVRKYYLQLGRNFVEYNIVGNAKNLTSWKAGKVLVDLYKKQDCQYVLGTEIDCTNKNKDFEKYQGNGWFFRSDPYGTFSVGPSSDLVFKIKDYHNQNLKFSFIAGAWVGDLPYRTGKVYVNEHFVSEIVLDGNYNKYTFKIEPSMFKGNEIKLRVDIDHSGIAVKEGLQDLGVLWLKLRIDEED